MERKEAIRSAYHMTGSNSFYDGMMTCSTLPGRAVCRLVWDMNRQDCVRYQEKAVSGIPEDFAGRLLEVPVGTGILTMPLYRTLPRAEITCLDYSPDMMAQAQEKARRMHLGNVAFRQGDVGALPFESGSFDAVLSLNGFHAFPDKEAAYREVFRVLRPGGVFWDGVACVYDVFANVINRKANRALCAAVEPWIEPGDEVLECACGTGLLSGVIAQRCGHLTATDFSAKMLRRAEKKYGKRGNIAFEQADILHLRYPDSAFDAVVAANVIHLLDEPLRALRELDRVCRPGGRIIIPTYMNGTESGRANGVSSAIGRAGADFKREFTPESYRAFFERAGYRGAQYTLCRGRIPCAVAVLRKTEENT